MARQSRARRRHGLHVAVEDPDVPGSCRRCQVPLSAANEAHVQPDDPALVEVAERQRAARAWAGERPDGEP